MNIPTLIILLILATAVFFIVRGMIRDKKSGKTCGSCGGGCSGCSGSCGGHYEAPADSKKI